MISAVNVWMKDNWKWVNGVWRKQNNKPVKNADLFMQLADLIDEMNVVIVSKVTIHVDWID